MTKVIGKWAKSRARMSLALCVLSLATHAQDPPAVRPAEALYLQLGTVGLDVARVYRVRDVSFERASFHITLDDGTIAFTQDVAGRVTGAFFEGDGEVLMSPPNQVERTSMALFTGAAILEEKFGTAYFRFNDDTFKELQPQLRPVDNAQEFATQWGSAAKSLADSDALRLFMTFSRFLPSTPPGPPQGLDLAGDRFLHARLQGRRLGTFDLYSDSASAEQIWAGQLAPGTAGISYYNVWSSFTVGASGARTTSVSGLTGEEGKADTIRITNYKIRTEVRPPTDLKADATLNIEVRQGGQRAVLFELSRYLQISQVDADGHPVEFIHNPAFEGTQLSRRGNDLVAIVFPQVLRTDQKIELHFVYAGSVLSEAGGGLLYVGARGTWYPNRGLAMGNFDLEFHYPPGWTLLATGKPVDGGPAGSNPAAIPPENVGRWVSDRPIPLAGFNLGRYTRASARAGTVPVDAYAAEAMERGFPKGMPEVRGPVLPGTDTKIVIPPSSPLPARNAQRVADQSAHAIEFYAQSFGPYPYSGLALTQMPGTLSQGWPGLIFLSSYSFLSPTERSQLHATELERTLDDIVVAHETAHQWWGDSLVWSSYRDQWLIEALANYSALMLLESSDPAKFWLALDSYRDNLLLKDKQDRTLMEAGPVTLGSRLTSSYFPFGYDAISYGRGTWLIHMLRTMMRDAGKPSPDPSQEPFMRALRRLHDRFEGKSITSSDLLKVLAEELPPSLRYEGKPSLDWFFQSWINGTAVPKFELQGVKYLDRPAGTAVSGTILQKFAPKEFVTSIPIYGSVKNRTVLLGRVFADGPESSFHLNAPAGTRKIVIDPNHTILSRPR